MSFKRPTEDQIAFFKKKAKVENTHKATRSWVTLFEKFRSSNNYIGPCENISTKEELERQLVEFFTVIKRSDSQEYTVSTIHSIIAALNRHFQDKSPHLRPINLKDASVFCDLNSVLQGKVRHLAEIGKGEKQGSNAFTMEEVSQILNHISTQPKHPWGLLKRIFFINGVFLGLRGGEHCNLCMRNFKYLSSKNCYEVTIYLSKKNQRTLEHPGQAEKITLPSIPEINQLYDFYISKRPNVADDNFYLQPIDLRVQGIN